MGQVQAAPGTHATAREFGLQFVSLGWEYFDMVIEQRAYFRHLFQQLIDRLKQPETRTLAELLGGYDLTDSGQLVWCQE